MESAKKCESFNEALKPSSDSVMKPAAGSTTNDLPQSYTAPAAPAPRIMYRPALTDVRDYMRTCMGRTLRSEAADEEARAFLSYNDAKGWRVTDWQEAARRWINRTESRKGLAIYEDPQQIEADEERRKAQEERKRVDILVDRIQHRAYTDEDGIEAKKVFDMIVWDDYTDESRAGIAKKVGQRMIDLWAWTYAEIIIMETYCTSSGGSYAKMIKDRIESGKPFVSFFWHGMEMKVKYFLEHWEKGPGRPIRRLTPITLSDKKDAPEKWKYIKTLVDRGDYSGGALGARARTIADKVERNDFSGGEDGEIAEWIVTGKVPTRPSQTASTSANQPKPLKGITSKALRNMGAQT